MVAWEWDDSSRPGAVKLAVKQGSREEWVDRNPSAEEDGRVAFCVAWQARVA